MVRKLHAKLIQCALELRIVDGPRAVLVKMPKYALPVLEQKVQRFSINISPTNSWIGCVRLEDTHLDVSPKAGELIGTKTRPTTRKGTADRQKRVLRLPR